MPASSSVPRIAVIGGGPAGLYAARCLQRARAGAVTVLEAGGAVGGVGHARAIDGHTFDFTTKYVPNTSLGGAGAPRLLQELLDECGGALRPAVDARWVSADGTAVVTVPAVFSAYPRLQLMKELAQGFALLSELQDLPDVGAVYRAGACEPGETIAQWGQRHNLRAFVTFLCWLNDAFAGASRVPSLHMPAGLVLRTRVMFYSGYVRMLFQRGGRKARMFLRLLRVQQHLSASLRIDNALVGLVRSAREGDTVSSCLVDGYPALWRRMVARERLDVRTDAPVERLAHQEDGTIVLQVGGASPHAAVYDRVVVASPPSASCRFLGPEHPATPLLSATVAPTRTETRVYMVRATGWPTHLLGDQGIMVFDDATLGTERLAWDARPYAVSKEYPDSDILLVPVYTRSDQIAPEAAEARLRQGLQARGLTVTEVIESRLVRYPRAVPLEEIRRGWFDRMAALQGQRRTVFVGEVFSAPGVPAVLQSVQHTISEHFPAQ